MLSLELITFFTSIAALVSFWWYSDRIKQEAMRHLVRHCQQQDLQLLDQSMVIRGLWLQRDADGHLQIRRRYVFEFTSTGEMRYKGQVTLLGRRMIGMEMEPHIMPESADRLH